MNKNKSFLSLFCQLRNCSSIYWYIKTRYIYIDGISPAITPPWLQMPNVGLKSILLLANKESGVRWGCENLLDKNSQEANRWPSLLTGDPEREHLFFPSQAKKAQESLTLSLLLPVSLSICIPSSSIFSRPNSCQLLTGSSHWAKVNFVNSVSKFHNAIKYPTTGFYFSPKV